MINKSTCRDNSLMIFVRKLVLVCLRHNILFKAKHISGFKNTLSFCVSQYEIFTFKAMCTMAFFAFLRIGEITVSTQDGVNGNL